MFSARSSFCREFPRFNSAETRAKRGAAIHSIDEMIHFVESETGKSCPEPDIEAHVCTVRRVAIGVGGKQADGGSRAPYTDDGAVQHGGGCRVCEAD